VCILKCVLMNDDDIIIGHNLDRFITLLLDRQKWQAPNDSKWVHKIGVSVEIELKMDWQGCKQVLNCQILHLIGQWD